MKKLVLSLFLVVVLAFTLAPDKVEANSHLTCFLGFCFDLGNVNPDPELSPDGTGGGLTTGSGRAPLNSLQDFILAIGIFLNNVVLPILFAIALLVFLVNVVRYFIIGSGNEDERAKARRLALYGIAAFVFLVSLWGLVNLLVGGLGFNNNRVMCPDYLPGSWCAGNGSTSYSQSSYFTGVYGQGTYLGGGYSQGVYLTGGYSQGTYSDEPPDTPSGIAAIVFADTKDSAELNFVSGPPRAAGGTPLIEDNMSCEIGLQILMLASDVEQNQTAYLLYQDNNFNFHWQNLTDIHYQNGIVYDADTINNLVASGAQNLYLIHTHQKNYGENASFIGTGMFPSASDMELMCDSVTRNLTHVTVDWNNLWVLEQQPSACPRSAYEESQFPTIEAMGLLSQIPAGIRNQEFFDLYNSPLVTNQYVRAFDAYKDSNFDAMTSGDIRSLVAPILSQARLSVRQTDITSFCSSI